MSRPSVTKFRFILGPLSSTLDLHLSFCSSKAPLSLPVCWYFLKRDSANLRRSFKIDKHDPSVFLTPKHVWWSNIFMLNPHSCNAPLKSHNLRFEGSSSFNFVDPLPSPRHQKNMNDSDAQVKPWPIEIDVTEVDWYQLTLDAFEPVIYPTLVYQVRHKHVPCAFADKGVAVRSQSYLEERAS